MTTTAKTTPVGSATTSPVGSATTSTLSDWAGDYVTDMLGRAKALSEEDYQVYGGPVTAGQSSLQDTYFKGVGSLAFPSKLGQSFSASAAPKVGERTATSVTADYMNPYLAAVLDPQIKELQRQQTMKQQEIAGKAGQAGAFGGSRYGLLEAEGQRNLLDQISKTMGQTYAAAYDKAQQQFNTEQEQAKSLAAMIRSAGAEQRAIDQEGITADYNEFLAQRDDPMKKVQFLQSMLQNLPISTVSSQALPQSGLGGAMSTAGSGLALYKQLQDLGIIPK